MPKGTTNPASKETQEDNDKKASWVKSFTEHFWN